MTNPHLERPSKRYRRMHEGKVQHKNIESAEQHAERLNTWKADKAAVTPWGPYLCPVCEHYHVGRASTKPQPGWTTPFDVTNFEALGSRAYFCGLRESTGARHTREQAVLQRAQSAVRRRARDYPTLTKSGFAAYSARMREIGMGP